MGKIVFIFSVIFSFLFLIQFMMKIRTKKEKITDEVQEKPVVKLHPSNDTGVLMIFGIIVLVLVAGYWWSVRFNSNSIATSIPARQINTVRAEQKQEEQDIPAVMRWEKPDDYDGISPRQRSLAVGVIIIRNTPEIMEMSSPGGTRFIWKKKEKYGDWFDAKGAVGKWRLEGTGKRMEGVVSDNLGTFIPMNIEID